MLALGRETENLQILYRQDFAQTTVFFGAIVVSCTDRLSATLGL